MRRTKIVCTIGPASNSEQQLKQLMQAGMNVARLNFSHGTQQDHAVVIQRIRSLAAELNMPIAILQDLQGPKLRVGLLEGGQPIQLVEGSSLTITTRQLVGNAQLVSTTYTHLPQDVHPGDHILLDDGMLELRVLECTDDSEVHTQVVHGGLLKEHKGLNLPGIAVSVPALTEKDREDLRFGVLHEVDYIALSFVQKAEDVLETKTFIHQLQQEQAQHNGHSKAQRGFIPVIAKLEKPEAIARLEEILPVVDGVMIARGDLGVEMDAAKVPLIQKRIIVRCNELGLPVITATQMLESMVSHPHPTRAETSDVANAILDGTDGVMLSAETASGLYPIEAVETMAHIALETEIGQGSRMVRQPTSQRLTKARAITHAARALSEEGSVRAIVVFTHSGASAQLISKERPRTHILAYTPDERVYRQLALWWGVWPYLLEMHGATEEVIVKVDQRLQSEHLVQHGDYVVIMGGMPVASRARTNFVKLHCVQGRMRGDVPSEQG